jgi:hypothetical protein
MSRNREQWALFRHKRERNTNSLVRTHFSILIGTGAFPRPECQGVVAGDRPLAPPDDRCAATVHADLAIHGCDVIAHRILREVQHGAHLVVAAPLTDETKDLALAVG